MTYAAYKMRPPKDAAFRLRNGQCSDGKFGSFLRFGSPLEEHRLLKGTYPPFSYAP